MTVPARLHFVLHVTRALTVRSPPSGLGLDAETARNPETRSVYIPSSTLRGVWRTASCYAAHEMGLTCCSSKHPDRVKEAHNALARAGAVLVEVDGDKLCHVCSVFGTANIEGVLFFTDAEPLGDIVSTGIRPGIEIDDYTGRVSRGKLYFMETVEPGSLFRFHIDVVAEPPGLSLCQTLELLAQAALYVEAVGVGSGAARPYLWRVEHVREHGKVAWRADTPAEAARQLGCSGLGQVFSRIWLPAELTIPLSLEEGEAL